MIQAARSADTLLHRLPPVGGRYREFASLAKVTWFQVGGAAEVFYKPDDEAGLAAFLSACPADVPVTVMGVGSNLLVRDGGVEGVVVRLGRGFTGIAIAEERGAEVWVRAGAGCLNHSLAQFCIEHGLAGLEFLSGIPGTVGGALAMNAGAYGVETADVLVQASCVERSGRVRRLSPADLSFRYRHASVPEGAVFTEALLKAHRSSPEAVSDAVAQIRHSREATQPVNTRTGGSTFKNPEGHKAWKLIDEAGCRGMTLGGAQVSELHCNFLINRGGATAADLEALGEAVRGRVKDATGIALEWEIRRIGV